MRNAPACVVAACPIASAKVRASVSTSHACVTVCGVSPRWMIVCTISVRLGPCPGSVLEGASVSVLTTPRKRGSGRGPRVGCAVRMRERAAAAFDSNPRDPRLGAAALERLEAEAVDRPERAVLAWGAQTAAGGGLNGTGALGPVDGFGLEALTRGVAEAGISRT